MDKNSFLHRGGIIKTLSRALRQVNEDVQKTDWTGRDGLFEIFVVA